MADWGNPDCFLEEVDEQFRQALIGDSVADEKITHRALAVLMSPHRRSTCHRCFEPRNPHAVATPLARTEAWLSRLCGSHSLPAGMNTRQPEVSVTTMMLRGAGAMRAKLSPGDAHSPGVIQ